MQFAIFLTDNAKSHFKKLTQDDKVIEISIKNSGCSGFKYVITLINQDSLDTLTDITKIQDIPFLIDENNYNALNNVVIDYKKTGLNYKLTFDNPNSSNECGCGESFSLKGRKNGI